MRLLRLLPTTILDTMGSKGYMHAVKLKPMPAMKKVSKLRHTASWLRLKPVLLLEAVWLEVGDVVAVLLDGLPKLGVLELLNTLILPLASGAIKLTLSTANSTLVGG